MVGAGYERKPERPVHGPVHRGIARLHGVWVHGRTGAMAAVVNLRKIRRQRDRERDAAEAAENRVRHGRTKIEKRAELAAAEQAGRVLDQARLQD